MSGIFDKYLNMINGSKNTMGQMHTRTNSNAYVTTINGHEVYVPYKKPRRSSSVSSTVSEEGLDDFRKSSVGSIEEEVVPEIKIIKKLSEPNNRVNFWTPLSWYWIIMILQWLGLR